MTDLIYEAAVYTRTVKYRNYQGDEKSVDLYFALDPLQLMQLIAGFSIKASKSGNPALRGKPEQVSDEQQIKFIRDLATKAAGSPSEDGESWTPFENFADSLAGKAFLTKLAASDGDRKEFAEKVIVDPFKAFVDFAKQDESNTPADVQQFEIMLGQIQKVFATPEKAEETVDEKRERLKREMAMLDESRNQAPAGSYANPPSE